MTQALWYPLGKLTTMVNKKVNKKLAHISILLDWTTTPKILFSVHLLLIYSWS
jgi:hypothetical protein